uniref:Uncharacterized protein n=1 Tax=viral metagenome TaxID=1070528 RepID=A0A6M3LFU6_9ZZZZ
MLQYYFLEHPDTGYEKLGLCNSQYSAMWQAQDVAEIRNDGRIYNLRDANDKIIGTVKSRPTAQYEWAKRRGLK